MMNFSTYYTIRPQESNNCPLVVRAYGEQSSHVNTASGDKIIEQSGSNMPLQLQRGLVPAGVCTFSSQDNSKENKLTLCEYFLTYPRPFRFNLAHDAMKQCIQNKSCLRLNQQLNSQCAEHTIVSTAMQGASSCLNYPQFTYINNSSSS